ncbi:MAG: [acyl-carrier-protein] S-malonyltransferase [Verrucomicrobiae bacterium]|nr:[acyl-carrier-protein] S-malonyltransferase [Verrucomicrobiae bacterium]
MGKTAILFAGQGAQVVGMGKDFSEKYSTAQALFQKADDILGYGLSKIIFEGPEEELTRTEHAQPAIFLMSWIAFSLLKELAPQLNYEATAGLSLGELTALTAADVFSFEEGLTLVRKRGIYMQEACEETQGGMAAVIGLDTELVREVCEQAGVQIANLNCPGQLVISGETQKVIEACAVARAKGAKRALPLAVAGAYHSPLMVGAQPKLRAALAETRIASPRIDVISNVTALPHEKVETIAETLVKQVTSPVLFEDSLRYLVNDGFTRFIEVGPGAVLSGFLKRITKEVEILNVSDMATLEKTISAL